MDSTATKGSLPDGWVVRVSKKFPDRVYYFNTVTGSSVWECPDLHPPWMTKNERPKSLSALDKPASFNHAVVCHRNKSPDIPHKIVEFLSDAKKESQKRSAETDTSLRLSLPSKLSHAPTVKRESQKRSAETEAPSRLSLPSKLSHPPTAIVTPVILDSKLTSVIKNKKKKSKKKKDFIAAVMAPCSSTGTILQRNCSDDTSKKVSFTVKSQNKIPISKSESTILSKSKKLATPFKKKECLVISLPTASKHNKSTNELKRCVTLNKNNVLPSFSSSDLQAKRKESSNKGLNSHHRFSSPKSEKDNLSELSGCKIDKQNKVMSQNTLSENIKRTSDAFNSNSGENLSTNKYNSFYEYDCEVSDMDCEMNSDNEQPTVASPAGIKIEPSTSVSTIQDLFDDIEMLDMSSNDLVRIDDMFGSGIQGSLVDRYFIVVDTNVLISELKYIDEMKDTPVNGCGPPHFIIPWVVFQELDVLKKNGKRPTPGDSKDNFLRKSYDCIKSASEAIRYLNALLKVKHPRFHFQHPDEATHCRKDFSRNNDDQLLECCLKLRERMSKDRVILLTNDRNLANKAMVIEVVVHDKSSLSNTLKSDMVTKEISPKAVSNVYVPDPFKALAQLKSVEQKYQAKHQKSELEIDAHMSEAKEVLKAVLEPLFETEMDEAYGDIWHRFPVVRHTLKGILNGIVRYWRTVFTLLFRNEDKEKFELLEKKVNRPEGFLGEREECLSILKTIEDVFYIIKRKFPKMDVPVAKIQKIKSMTEESFSDLSESEKNLTEFENKLTATENSCCIEVFNHNWTIINHLCGSTLDFCGLPHDLMYDTSIPFPPKSEFLRIMPKLQSSLNRLQDIFERMLLVVKSSAPSNSVFKEMHKMLLEFVPNLNIQAEKLSINYFSAKLLERFCRLPENRSRIEEGYKQLLNFNEKLGNALHVLLNMA